MAWAVGLARLWTPGLVLEGLEVAAGFAVFQPEFVAAFVPEFVAEIVPEIAPASAASAAEARGPARSNAWPARVVSPPQAARRTRQVAVESGEYRESCDRKVTSPLRRGSPVELVGGKTG